MFASRPWSIQRWFGGLVAGVVLPVLLLLIWISVVQVRREQAEVRQTALNMARATAGRMRDRHSESVALLAQTSARLLTGYASPALERIVAGRRATSILTKPQSVVYLSELVAGTSMHATLDTQSS